MGSSPSQHQSRNGRKHNHWSRGLSTNPQFAKMLDEMDAADEEFDNCYPEPWQFLNVLVSRNLLRSTLEVLDYQSRLICDGPPKEWNHSYESLPSLPKVWVQGRHQISPKYVGYSSQAPDLMPVTVLPSRASSSLLHLPAIAASDRSPISSTSEAKAKTVSIDSKAKTTAQAQAQAQAQAHLQAQAPRAEASPKIAINPKIPLEYLGKPIEAQDSYGYWFVAEVIDVDFPKCGLLVHFLKFDHKWDEWLHWETNRNRIRPASAASLKLFAQMSASSVPASSVFAPKSSVLASSVPAPTSSVSLPPPTSLPPVFAHVPSIAPPSYDEHLQKKSFG